MIIYYKTHGITILKKLVDANHSIIAKKFEDEINNEIIGIVEKQLTKKRPNFLASAIFYFFLLLQNLSKRMMCNKNIFLQNLGLLIVKNNLPL